MSTSLQPLSPLLEAKIDQLEQEAAQAALVMSEAEKEVYKTKVQMETALLRFQMNAVRLQIAQMRKEGQSEYAVNFVISGLAQKIEDARENFFRGNQQFAVDKTLTGLANRASQNKIDSCSFDFSPIKREPFSEEEKEPASSSFLQKQLKVQAAAVLTVTHTAAKVVQITGDLVYETAKFALCTDPFNPGGDEAKKNCKTLLHKTVEGGKALADSMGLKKPIKQTAEFIKNTFDGSSTASVLEGIGVKKEAAKQLGQMYVQDNKTISLAIVPVPLARPALKLAKQGVKVARTVASSFKEKAAFPYLNRIYSEEFFAFQRVAELIQGPAPLYVTAMPRGPAAFGLRSSPGDFPMASFFSMKQEGKGPLRATFYASQKEHALRASPLPEIKLPPDLPKHFNEFCHKAQVFESRKAKASIFNVSVDSSKGPCTLYLLAKQKSWRQGVKEVQNNPLIAPIKHVSSEERLRAVLDALFDRSRAAGHSRAFILVDHQKKGHVLPIMTVLENRAEKIVGKTSFSKGPHQEPMIVLEVELNPNLPMNVGKALPSKGRAVSLSSNASNIEQFKSDVYPLLQSSRHLSFSQAIQKHLTPILSKIPDYSHLGKTREEILAKLFAKKGSLKSIETCSDSSFFLRFEDGGSLIAKIQKTVDPLHQLVGQDLFSPIASPHFKIPNVKGFGKMQGGLFIVTEAMNEPSFARLTRLIGQNSSDELLLFNRLAEGSYNLGRGSRAIHSIPVEGAFSMRSEVPLYFLANQVKRTNQALERLGMKKMDIDKVYLERLYKNNKEPLKRTYGLGTNFSLKHFIKLEGEAGTGLIQLREIPHFTTATMTPFHCPVKEVHAISSVFNEALIHGMKFEKATTLKRFFKIGYDAAQQSVFPEAAHNVHELYFNLVSIRKVAEKIKPEDKEIISELKKLIDATMSTTPVF